MSPALSPSTKAIKKCDADYSSYGQQGGPRSWLRMASFLVLRVTVSSNEIPMRHIPEPGTMRSLFHPYGPPALDEKQGSVDADTTVAAKAIHGCGGSRPPKTMWI